MSIIVTRPFFATSFPTTEQEILVGSDTVAGDIFGISTGISSDGNTAIVGARSADLTGSNEGAAYVFVRSGSTWTQQEKLTADDATDADNFGVASALSADGNTAIVGANLVDGAGNNRGAAYVFVRSGSTWTQQQKLTADDAADIDVFGLKVAISSDGDTVLIGSQNDAGGSTRGAAYVFTRSGSTWTQQQKLVAGDPEDNARFSSSIALSPDGDTAVVCAFNEDLGGSDRGAAYIFTRSGSVWTQQDKIVAGTVEDELRFGTAVAASNNGNVVIVGASYENLSGSSRGAAYVFTRSGSTWTQAQKLTASDGANGDFFGTAIAISSAGTVALIGAPSWEDTGTARGAVYVFTLDGIWGEHLILSASDAADNDNFGTAVALSLDGRTGLVGSFGADAAYVFV